MESIKLLERIDGAFRYVTQVEHVTTFGSKKVLGLQIVERQLSDRLEGYTIDYGITKVLRKELFDKPMLASSNKLEIAKQAFIQHLQ